MPNLEDLGLRPETDVTVDHDRYVDPSEFPPPVPDGVYTLTQGRPHFLASKDGQSLVALFDSGDDANGTPHKILGGERDGTPVRFDRVSDKPFNRQGVKVSMAADQVRAVFGSTERPRSHGDYARLLERGEGRSFKAQLQWDGGCNHKGTQYEVDWDDKAVYRIRGQRNFPSDPNNPERRLETATCPRCDQEVRARTRIARRIPA